MTTTECKTETLKHIHNVEKFISIFINNMINRAHEHDRSKLESPELEIFTEYTPKLAHTTYGSKEYKEYLKEMNVALKHHYANNTHHPEHFRNGIDDMTLIDVMEMLCDWKAASLRHDDGDIHASIDINAKRFNCSEQLKQILYNTAHELDNQLRGFDLQEDHADFYYEPDIQIDFGDNEENSYEDMTPEINGIGDISDGYHTFNELYHHRAILFSVICNMMPDKAWKSKLHHTGDMYDGMFIVGIETPEGQATYHYDINPYWDMFKVKELQKAPQWDGHSPQDAIKRISTLA